MWRARSLSHFALRADCALRVAVRAMAEAKPAPVRNAASRQAAPDRGKPG